MKRDFLKLFIAAVVCLGLSSITGCKYVSEKVGQIFGETVNEDDALKAKELELKERELALKEKESQSNNVGSASTFTANARVTGSAVQLRQDHSTTAQSVKSMKKNDLLQVLEEFVPQGNYGEAILTQKTDFYDEYYGNYSFSLPKGKAVMVEGSAEGNRVSISYQDAKTKRKGYAKISSNLLEFISGKAWYRVKREDGLTGWVYSEFVEKI